MICTADGGGKTGDLLELELDCVLHVLVLACDSLVLLDCKWELTRLNQLPSHKLSKSLHQLLTGK